MSSCAAPPRHGARRRRSHHSCSVPPQLMEGGSKRACPTHLAVVAHPGPRGQGILLLQHCPSPGGLSSTFQLQPGAGFLAVQIDRRFVWPDVAGYPRVPHVRALQQRREWPPSLLSRPLLRIIYVQCSYYINACYICTVQLLY